MLSIEPVSYTHLDVYKRQTIYSVNVVYAQLTMEVGAENIEKLCEEMEIYDIGSNPAIGLGGLETGITPLDVSKIFSTCLLYTSLQLVPVSVIIRPGFIS